MAAKTITRDDWLKAIAETTADKIESDPSVLSYYDFAAQMGVAIATARSRLNGLVEAGRAVRTTKRTVTPDGRLRTVVAFRLKK